ncbi:hypothetical protein EBZ39_00580 [bacterium]|nr:hypothetical protein [bacterium]
MEPLFVFCADLHLEDGAWSSRPGIYGDAYYSFEQIVDYCIQHKLPLIMGGDILEKKQNLARPIAKLARGLTRLQNANVNAYYIQGNHEYDRNAPWLSVHPWPIHLHDAGVEFGGVTVWGLDWHPKGEIQEALKTLVPTDTQILITHQVWKDFMGEIGRTECDLTDVHHAQIVLAGDFHVTKTVTGVNAQGKPITMLSPGSTAMQDMAESPDKFFFVIGKGTDEQIEFQPVQLKTRRFANYVVKDVETLDRLCAGQLAKEIQAMLDSELPEEINKPLIRIKFDKRLPDAYLRIMTAVSHFGHIACEAITEKSNTRSAMTSRDTSKNDLTTAVADLLGDTSEAYKLATALLNSPDPVKEFDAQFSKYVGELDDATLETGSPELGAPSTADV